MQPHEAIPGWFNFSRAYLEAIELAKDGARFVEVGCWAGRSAVFLASQIAQSGKKIRLHCVDHWQGSAEHQADPNLTDIYDIFLANTRSLREALGDDFVVMRSDSVKAAKRFKNASLDFVWLDAGHALEEVRADIRAWLPKVKPGGVIGGDDFPMEGVRDAVHAELGREAVRRMPENGWESWWYTVPRGA